MKKSRLEITTIMVYSALVICFVLFAVYIGFFEGNTEYSARSFGSSHSVDNVVEQVISDASAPLGVRREFTWTMPDCEGNEYCLAFYLVHHSVEVRFDGQLVYSLTPSENNQVCRSPSSNWVFIPVYPTDAGRQVTVTATPVFESVLERKIEFQIGPRFAIVKHCLEADLPQLLLSALCMLMGILLITVQIYLLLHKKTSSWELFYLGIFALLIGIWRIADTRSSPLLFPTNPMMLGYITIGALFLICPPMLLYMKEFYRSTEKPLLIFCLISCAVTMFALVCQLSGLAEFRETLIAEHVTLIAILVVILCICIYHVLHGTDNGTWKFIALLATGAVSDLANFYRRGSSSGIIFTIAALLIFTIYRFISGILRANRKAYTDAKTGLFNRNRWDELMKVPRSNAEPFGMIMLDLNRLKYINDTMGHEAGDKMIYNFANILRNTIPPSNTICRWGGDEFTVIITNATQEKMEQLITAISDAAERYNASGEVPKIYYAAGWVLSTEFPELGPKELLRKADERMYQDKQQWYTANVGDN